MKWPGRGIKQQHRRFPESSKDMGPLIKVFPMGGVMEFWQPWVLGFELGFDQDLQQTRSFLCKIHSAYMLAKPTRKLPSFTPCRGLVVLVYLQPYHNVTVAPALVASQLPTVCSAKADAYRAPVGAALDLPSGKRQLGESFTPKFITRTVALSHWDILG